MVEKCNIVDICLKNFKDKNRFKNSPIFRFIEIFTSVQKLVSEKTNTLMMIIKKFIISNNYLMYFVQAHIHFTYISQFHVIIVHIYMLD